MMLKDFNQNFAKKQLTQQRDRKNWYIFDWETKNILILLKPMKMVEIFQYVVSCDWWQYGIIFIVDRINCMSKIHLKTLSWISHINILFSKWSRASVVFFFFIILNTIICVCNEQEHYMLTINHQVLRDLDSSHDFILLISSNILIYHRCVMNIASCSTWAKDTFVMRSFLCFWR